MLAEELLTLNRNERNAGHLSSCSYGRCSPKREKRKGSAGDAVSGAALRSGRSMLSFSIAKLASIPAKT